MGRASRLKGKRGQGNPIAVIEEYERKGWIFVDYTVSGDELRVMILHRVTGEKKTLWFMSGGDLHWADILPAQGPWHTGQPY